MECAGRGCWHTFALVPKGKGLMLKQKQIPFGNDNKKTKGTAKEIRLAGDHQGLPEFDAVAFGVGDPGEAAVVFVLALGIDGYAVCG